jgi:branched-chain amino acid transport system substrate-binding protein
MRSKGFIATALSVVAFSGVVAGCGSDDSDTATTGAAASTTTAAAATSGAAAPTGRALKVGVLCSCTGPASGTSGGTPKVAEAWEKSINEAGGIDGHPVQVVLADDQNNPANSVKQARKLVDQDKVLGIVDVTYNSNWIKYPISKGVPILGGNSTQPHFASEPLAFPSGASVPALYYGMADLAKKAGKTKLSVLACAELPVCGGAGDLLNAIGTKVVGGVSVVNQGKIAATSPNYTAVCLKAKSDGADAGVFLHSSEVTVRVADSCAQQNYKPLIINYASTLAANWLKSPAFDGALTAQNNVPLTDTTTPGGKAFNDAMDRYEPDYRKSSQYGVISLNIWSGFELFKAGIEKGKLGADATPAKLVANLQTFKGETLGGIAPPLTFTKGQPTFVTCYFVMGVKDGAYSAPQGAKPSCMPESKVPALGKILAAAG